MLLSLTTQTREPGIVIVSITGRIALGVEKGQIEDAVVGALKDGVRRIVIDLAHVSYIDSAGVGIIAFCFGKASQLGAQFSVAATDARVTDVFRITRLDQVVTFFPDVDSACAALGAARPTEAAGVPTT
jgi:anti-sigma B factor antagonist